MTYGATIDQERTASSATTVPEGLRGADAARTVVGQRLSELLALQPNWDGYGAERIDPDALRFANDVLDDVLEWPIPAPQIFPVPDGGVQLEWSAGPVELELELEPGGRSAIFICDDLNAKQRFDGELPRDQGLLQLAFSRLAAYRPT